MNPHAGTELTQTVDASYVRDLLLHSELAGVRLDEALRARIIALVSRLAGSGLLTPDRLYSHMRPLLRGLAEDREQFDLRLRKVLDGSNAHLASRSPPADRSASREQTVRTERAVPRLSTRMIALALFIGVMVAIAAQAFYFLQRPETPATQQRADVRPTSTPSAAPTRAEAPSGGGEQQVPKTTSPQAAVVHAPAVTRPIPQLGEAAEALAEVSGKWLATALYFGIALVALIAVLRQIPVNAKRIAHGATPRMVVHIPQTTDEGVDRLWLKEWRRILGHPVLGRPEVDLEASVIATAAAAGYATLRVRMRRVLPSYTVMIERRSGRDALASWWSRIFATLERTGITLQTSTFRRETLAYGATLPPSLVERIARFGRSGRVLVMGDISRAESGILKRFLGPAPAPITLRSAPLSPKGEREQDNETQRLTGALQDLVEDGPGHPLALNHLFGPHRDWFDETPLSDRGFRLLYGTLALHLGPTGLRWLVGCALFPVLSEGTAWQVAETLGIANDPAIGREAQRLFALPWLREGWFPQWLRQRLMRELDRDDAAALCALICDGLTLASGEARKHRSAIGFAAPENQAVELGDDLLLAQFVVENVKGAVGADRLTPEAREVLVPSLARRLLSVSSWPLAAPPFLWGCVAAILFVISPTNLVLEVLCYVSLVVTLALTLLVLSRLSLREIVLGFSDWRRRVAANIRATSLFFSFSTETYSGNFASSDLRAFELTSAHGRSFPAFRGLGWFLASAIMAPACYLVTSRGSVEQQRLVNIEAKIAQAKKDIRQLETELETRASLEQIERWNGDVLALSSPTSDQYVPLAQLEEQKKYAVEPVSLVVPRAPPCNDTNRGRDCADRGREKP